VAENKPVVLVLGNGGCEQSVKCVDYLLSRSYCLIIIYIYQLNMESWTGNQALFIWSRVPETTLPRRATLSSVNQMCKYPLSWRFPRSFHQSGFWGVNFTSLIQISAFNALNHAESSPAGRTKAFIWRKVFLPGLPYLQGRDNSPLKLTRPWDGFAILM